jgi:nitrogen fixation NifU-like protein
MLTDQLRGMALAEVAKLDRDAVLENLGIEISPARLKCALLSLQTLRGALGDRVDWQGSADE